MPKLDVVRQARYDWWWPIWKLFMAASLMAAFALYVVAVLQAIR